MKCDQCGHDGLTCWRAVTFTYRVDGEDGTAIGNNTFHGVFCANECAAAWFNHMFGPRPEMLAPGEVDGRG